MIIICLKIAIETVVKPSDPRELDGFFVKTNDVYE